MAELGDIQVAPDGQPHQLTPQGWKPISQQQAEAETMPAFGRFIGGLTGQDAPGIAGALGKLSGVGLAVGEPTVLLGRAGARAGASALRRQFGGRSMPDRVQGRIQQAARPEQPVFQAQPGAGGLQPPQAPGGFGATSVGAGGVGPIPPAPVGRFGKIIDQFLDQRPLRTDQRRILETGRSEQLGFRHLPGEREGRNLLVAGAKSDPIVASAFDDILTGNREQGARLARKALGLEDSVEFGRAELGEAAESIGARLNQVADDIKPVALNKDLTRRINKLRKVDDDLDDALDDVLGIEKLGVKKGVEEIAVTGEELLGVRSQLSSASSQAWRQGAAQRGKRIDGIITKIDDVIEKNSTNPAARADYAQAREQWRILKQLEKPNVVSEAGDINFQTLARQFTKEFKGDFGRSTFARETSRLSQESKDLLDFTKIGASFKDAVGDSGTATRLGFQTLLNPKALVQRVAMRTAFEQIIKQGQ